MGYEAGMAPRERSEPLQKAMQRATYEVTSDHLIHDILMPRFATKLDKFQVEDCQDCRKLLGR